ncbi:YbaB/EbfC family nucleoid-associated protein [Planctomicrobium piriforme]|uniref:Nucleoid-associated protein SAMN05421753_102185 n=1 Tax=Planctomicrobium piriforme TaxID=1576369 RepID=A0A1I3C9Q6_9PLAN|nr:YbaB/EbfC family nucleoid-associated protein [Planctomicrobium piriforme]SFH71268.1 hypothetical protein SAMN05421753_102185 [Planctomicrobium piriforme]
MFEALSNLAGLMKNAQQIQGRAQDMQQRLGEMRVEAASDDGTVRVVVTGELQLASLNIAPEALSNPRQLEEQIVATVNQAMTTAKEAAAQEMASLADGLGMPGMPGLQQAMAKFGPGRS